MAAPRGSGRLKAGAGCIEITPIESTHMPGFGHPDSRPSRGVYEKLYINALTLDDGVRRAAIVGADFLGWSNYLTDEMRRRLRKSCGLHSSGLFLNASHTHCGPKTSSVGELTPSGGFFGASLTRRDPKMWGEPIPYVESILERTVELVETCFSRAKKARLYFGRGRCDMACNRRALDESGRAVWGLNIFGPADHDVPVLKVTGLDENVVAILMNYSCHTTTIGGFLLGPDYAGYARSFIETRLPGATAVFLQGCGGDTKPGRRNPDNPSQFDYSGGSRAAREMGEKLGRVVLDVLAGEMTEIRGPIIDRWKAVKLPLMDVVPAKSRLARPFQRPERRLARLAKAMLRSIDRRGNYRKTFPAEIQTIEIGKGLALVGISGEVCAGIGLDIKARLDPRPAMVCGYTNRYYTPYNAYIPSRHMIEEGGYEASVPFSPEMQDFLVAQIIKLCGGNAVRWKRLSR